MNEATYHVVLFNVDKPAEPSKAKILLISKSMYDNVMAGIQSGFHLGAEFYEVQNCRAFDLTIELFGTRHMLIIDVKKKES